MKPRLKFATRNAKLKTPGLAIFSLPAGFTCPGALQCLSRAHRITGKLTDGVKSKFRCYAASAENLFRNIRVSRWRNFDMLKGKSIAEMAELISYSLPRAAVLVRIHQSGDFFSQNYFDAWLQVAKDNPTHIFYGYTKALNFWVTRLGQIPNNLRLVASYGGRFDDMIKTYNLRHVIVVGLNPKETPEAEAKRLGIPIDHDDSHVWNYGGSFAISLHGTQPPGTDASKSWQQIKTQGRGGYKTDYFGHYAKSGKMSARYAQILSLKKSQV